MEKIPIDLDQSTVMVRLRNKYTSPDKCDLMKVLLYGKQSSINISFAKDNCHNEAKINVASTALSALYKELPTLTGNYEEFHEFQFSCHSDTFTLKQNDIMIKSAYQGELDTLMGIKLWFTGGGEIDYIRCYNQTNELIYQEEFNSQ